VPRTTGEYRADAPIVPELAAGAVVMGPDGRALLLLHHHAEDRWCFPKGHVDPGESLAAAAAREIVEESGLRHVSLDREIAEVAYRYYRPDRHLNVHKTTVYFLGRSPDRELRLEATFDRATWVELDEAMRMVPYDTDRTVLEAARRRLP
jgi:diadenosine hexaphosphate hydrolase (ATP-forming)